MGRNNILKGFAFILGLILIMPVTGLSKDKKTIIPADDPSKPRLVVQLGHSHSVQSVTFSPDGRQVLSGSTDKTLKLWDVATGKEIRTFRGHSHSVQSVTFSPDGRQVLSGSTDKTLKLWDVATGKEIRTFTGHSDWVSSVTFSPDGKYALSGSTDTTLRLWDTATGKKIRTFRGHSDSVFPGIFYSVLSVTFSPDGKYILSGGRDSTLRLWDIVTGKEIHTFRGHSHSVQSVTFSPDGRQVLSGSTDKTLRLWDVATGKEIRTFTGHSDHVRAVAFSPDGRHILSASQDKTLKLWEVVTGKEIRTFTGHSGEILSVAFSPDGKYVLSGSRDETLKLWDVATGKEVRTLAGQSGSVESVAFSPDGRHILSGSRDKTLKLWEVVTGKEIRTFTGHSGEVLSVAFSPDGKYVLSGSDDTTLRFWDVATGKEIRTFTGHSDWVSSVTFSPDGKYALSGSTDDTLKLWDTATGKKIRTLGGSFRWVESVAFSPDGKQVLSGGGDDTLKLWDTATGKKIRTFRGHSDSVTSVTFSPDGRHVLSGSRDKTLKLWEVVTGKEIRTFTGHSDHVRAVTFSPDGRQALSGGRDETLRLWDVATGKEIRTFTGHSDWVSSVTFSPDGRHILSASQDKTTILWDASTGRWLAKLISFTDGTWAVVDPEGHFDTNNLEEIKGLHWVMPDDPLTPLPLEVFMKDYYEPGLLPRILNNEKLKPVRALLDLNRVLPRVSLQSIEREGNGDTVKVTVEVATDRRDFNRQGKMVSLTTGVHDVKLFRDGQLVGFKEGKAELQNDGKQVLTFTGIRLPRRAGVKETEFSAYAFNDDGVKSLTDRRAFAIPRDISPKKGKAYVVTIGVNTYQNEAWNLHYAVNDAKGIQNTLQSRIAAGRIYPEIVPVILTDKDATKKNLKGLFDLLSGKPVDSALRQQIPNADQISRATPEDLLILSFSGHGHADEKGTFYIFTHDTGEGTSKTVTKDLLEHIVSSAELSLWLRDVDAGDMAMIIDACHSAASVAVEGFKPGPMGSRGLGQLAYDKGMKILAASQADDVALESERLKQGLLSYALVRDGIEAFQADFKPADKTIYLGEWLAYGVDRVPVLYREVRSGTISTFGRGEASRATVLYIGDKKNSSLKKKNPYQTPALFDFTRRKQDVYITGQGKP